MYRDLSASVWALACQVSMRRAPVACLPLPLPNLSGSLIVGGRIGCMLPLTSGRLRHLVVLYGYQRADTDAEQLALTEQLFDAALGELSVVARGQPCMIVGDFNVEPTKIPCLTKVISAGLWVDCEEAWAFWWSS